MANSNFTRSLMTLFLMFIGFLSNAQEKIIDEWELPKTARDFISMNFPQQKILKITREGTGIEKEYEAFLDNSVKIEFDNLGYWKEVDGKNTAISTKFILRNILEYIEDKYPNEKIGKIEKDPEKYEVELLNGIQLEFNLKGKFLRIDN